MTNKEFLEESNRYIDDVYSEFCQYQDMVWNMYVWFNVFCKKNNIQHFIGYGSLIGVIRDKGNIPWDYDIDVIVKIDDMDRIIKLLEQQIPDDLYFTHLGNVRKYPTFCLRICKRGYPFTSIHLDVFSLIGNPDVNTQVFIDKVEHYHVLREIKYCDQWYPLTSEPARSAKIINILRRLRKLLILDSKLRSFESKAVKMYPLKKSTYCSVFGEPYKKMYYTEDFAKAFDVEFRGIRVPVPIGYERYLTSIYKDYKKYLPIKQRFEEFYSMTIEVRKRNEYMNNDRTGLFDFCK